MSVDVHASKIEIEDGTKMVEPLFDFDCFEQSVSEEFTDPDGYQDFRFIPNPNYVEHSGVNVSNNHAYSILSELGYNDFEFPLTIDPQDLLGRIKERFKSPFQTIYLQQVMFEILMITMKGIENNCDVISFS